MTDYTDDLIPPYRMRLDGNDVGTEYWSIGSAADTWMLLRHQHPHAEIRVDNAEGMDVTTAALVARLIESAIHKPIEETL